MDLVQLNVDTKIKWDYIYFSEVFFYALSECVSHFYTEIGNKKCYWLFKVSYSLCIIRLAQTQIMTSPTLLNSADLSSYQRLAHCV